MFSLSNYEFDSVDQAVDNVVDIMKSGIMDCSENPDVPMSIFFTYDDSLVDDAYIARNDDRSTEKLFPIISCLHKYEEVSMEIYENNDDDPEPQIIIKNPLNHGENLLLIVEDYRFEDYRSFSISLNEDDFRKFLYFMMDRGCFPYDRNMHIMRQKIRKNPRNKSARF